MCNFKYCWEMENVADIQRNEEKSHMCVSVNVSIAVNPGSYAILIPSQLCPCGVWVPISRQDRKGPLMSSYSTLVSSVPGEWRSPHFPLSWSFNPSLTSLTFGLSSLHTLLRSPWVHFAMSSPDGSPLSAPGCWDHELPICCEVHPGWPPS